MSIKIASTLCKNEPKAILLVSAYKENNWSYIVIEGKDKIRQKILNSRYVPDSIIEIMDIFLNLFSFINGLIKNKYASPEKANKLVIP